MQQPTLGLQAAPGPAAAAGTAAGRDLHVPLVAAAGAGLTALALVAAVTWGGAAQPDAFGDAGAVTRWGLLVARAAYDVAAIATVGVLAVAVLLLPAQGGALDADAVRLVRLAARWAGAWALIAVAGALLALSDTAGLPLPGVLTPDLLALGLDLPHVRALLSSAWLAGLVAVWSWCTRTSAGGWLLLVTAGAALLPTLVDAHGTQEQSHSLGVASLVVHVGAASVWLGGLLALALHLGRSSVGLAAALPRYSRAALGCCGLVGLTGVLTASTALDRYDQVWSTPYGQLVLVKAAALALLALLGHRHRRSTVAAVAAGRPRAFLVLAAGELVLMAATAGLAVGLAGAAPPASADHAAARQATQIAVGPAGDPVA